MAFRGPHDAEALGPGQQPGRDGFQAGAAPAEVLAVGAGAGASNMVAVADWGDVRRPHLSQPQCHFNNTRIFKNTRRWRYKTYKTGFRRFRSVALWRLQIFQSCKPAHLAPR